MAKSWQRKQGETGPAFEAFCQYRDMPYMEEPTGRSLAKVGQKLGKSVSLMERWSTAHDWQERCRDYDNEIQKQEFEARKLAVKKMQKEHISLAGQLADKAKAALEKMEPEEMKPRNVLDFLKLSMELERRARFELLADSELKDKVNQEATYSPMEQLTRTLKEAYEAQREQEENPVFIYLPARDGETMNLDNLTDGEIRELKRLQDKAGMKQE